nr:RyR domain-containing protein [Thiocapsa imhoffii]
MRTTRRRVTQIDPQRLATLDLKGVGTCILVDPPNATSLVEQLIASWPPPRRRASRPNSRLILMHRGDAPPHLPVLAPDHPVRLETFGIESRAARILLSRWPLHLGMDPCFGQSPHLLIAGFDPPAQALLVHALRLIQYGNDRAHVSIFCHQSQQVETGFLAAYPQARAVASIAFAPLTALTNPSAPRPMHLDAHSHGTDTEGAAEELGAGRDIDLGPAAARPVTLAIVCLDDAARAGLATAARIREILARQQGVSPPILLETGQLHEPDQHHTDRIAPWDGQLIPIAYQREACRAEVLLDGAGDDVARTIHDHYRDSIAAQGRDPAREPAGQPWPLLAESYRQANRHQADHVWAKLAVIDSRAVAEEMVESFIMTPMEVERLAIIEHERWAADRSLDGWSYAPVRDNRLKHHPQLIPYAELSEPMKDLDRFAVRGLPTLLARQGLGILRRLLVALPDPADEGLDQRRLDRLTDQALARVRARYPDRAPVLATTLLDPRTRRIVQRTLAQAPDTGLFVLLPGPLQQILSQLSGSVQRDDYMSLLARAERRISLADPSQVTTWFHRRGTIHLLLGDAPAPPEPAKWVRILSNGVGHDWNFEY